MQFLQGNMQNLAVPKPVSRPLITPAPVRTNGHNTLYGAVSASSQPAVPAPAKVPIYAPAPTSTQAPSSMPVPDHAHHTLTPQGELYSTPSATTPSPVLPRSSGTPGPTPEGRLDLKITPATAPNEPPAVEPSRIDTVTEAWEEYRYGRAGNVAVEKLDALWGPRWRQDPKLRTWYQRRKAIADRIQLYMADGLSEKDAVMEVEKMRRGRTLNWISRLLLDDAKETRRQRRVAAQAATAARAALHAAPAV